jgi:hypothetical protein
VDGVDGAVDLPVVAGFEAGQEGQVAGFFEEVPVAGVETGVLVEGFELLLEFFGGIAHGLADGGVFDARGA